MIINSSEFVNHEYYLELKNDFYEDTEISFELVTDELNSIYSEPLYALVKANKMEENNLYNTFYQSLKYARDKL